MQGVENRIGVYAFRRRGARLDPLPSRSPAAMLPPPSVHGQICHAFLVKRGSGQTSTRVASSIDARPNGCLRPDLLALGCALGLWAQGFTREKV